MDEIIEKIIQLVCSHFGCTPTELISKCRRQELADARTAFYHAIYANGIMDGVKLGKFFNYSSRNSYYHIRKYGDMKTNKVFAVILKRFEDDVKTTLENGYGAI